MPAPLLFEDPDGCLGLIPAKSLLAAEPRAKQKAPSFIQEQSVAKLCALYKPILRRFRGYLRKKFDQKRGPSTYQHWKSDVYIRQVHFFMTTSLGLP